MNLAEWLVRTTRRTPNAPALLGGKNIVANYAEFARRVAKLASALHSRLGVGPGDRVAVVASNCIEYLELLYAVWFAGAAVVPINFKLHAKEAAWIIENAEAKAVFVSESVAAELVPLLHACHARCPPRPTLVALCWPRGRLSARTNFIETSPFYEPRGADVREVEATRFRAANSPSSRAASAWSDAASNLFSGRSPSVSNAASRTISEGREDLFHSWSIVGLPAIDVV